MTLYINATTEKIASNNIAINGVVSFVLKGQYSKTDEVFPATISIQNDRYTELELTFPSDFKDQHKTSTPELENRESEVFFRPNY